MKINYDLKLQEELQKIGNQKPTLLLHVCCGPCSSNVIKELCEHFEITIYYSNSNIYPSDEYQRRFHELLSFIERFNHDFNQNIQVIEDPYNNSEWISHLYPLKDYPEGSVRDQWQSESPKFLYADFKKNNGYLKSTQMTKEYGMYRQNYCGCMFSYEEMLKREEHKVEQKQDA